MSSEGFTGEGFEGFPALYHDTKRLHNIVDWSQELLEARLREYAHFLGQTALMPRARETANRLREHMEFELVQREDFDREPTLKELDELCGGIDV